MPGTYPPPAPTLSGDLLTIHRLLQSPTQIRRRLQTIRDLRFVADQMLTQRYRSSGGAVLYEVSEGIFTDREVGPVAPGSEYPMANTDNGTAAMASVDNWGQATRLTDARIKRSRYAGQELDRTLRKLMNAVIRKVDRLAIAAVAANVTQTVAATAPWADLDDATILRDIERGKAVVTDLDFGYLPDSILMSTTRYADFISDDKINNLRRREDTTNPVYTGTIERIANLAVLTTAASNLPTDDVWILDSTQLGGMADETELDPGYSVGDLGVQVQSERVAKADRWDVWARRITVPVICEPGAAIRITETDGS